MFEADWSSKNSPAGPKKGLEGLKRGSIKNKRCGYTSKIKVKSMLLVKYLIYMIEAIHTKYKLLDYVSRCQKCV